MTTLLSVSREMSPRICGWVLSWDDGQEAYIHFEDLEKFGMSETDSWIEAIFERLGRRR